MLVTITYPRINQRINQRYEQAVLNMECVPRVGDYVNLYQIDNQYDPAARVSKVVWAVDAATRKTAAWVYADTGERG